MDRDRELHSVEPNTKEDLLPNVSRQNRGTVSRVVPRERRILEGWV